MNHTKQYKNQGLIKLLNTINSQFSIAKDQGLNLYTITFRFNGLRSFKSLGEGERQAEERVLFWFHGVLKRLFARPWSEGVFSYIFFDIGGEGISGAHAHGLIAISDEGYREKYRGMKFDQCFNGENYSRWILPTDSRGNKDLLKGYWVKGWDGETGLLKYSAKSYEWGGSFYGGNPLYVTGDICRTRMERACNS